MLALTLHGWSGIGIFTVLFLGSCLVPLWLSGSAKRHSQRQINQRYRESPGQIIRPEDLFMDTGPDWDLDRRAAELRQQRQDETKNP